MATYIVTKIRKERSDDRRHRHIEGVITSTGVLFTRREVVDSINAGNVWNAICDGHSAKLHARPSCPETGCSTSPYLATDAESAHADTLGNLSQH